jgi:4-hydroxybenzoate polyprenyltransferase
MRTILALFGFVLFVVGMIAGGGGAMGFTLSIIDHDTSRLLPAAIMFVGGMVAGGLGLLLMIRYKDKTGPVFGIFFVIAAIAFVWAIFLPDISGQWLLVLLAAAMVAMAWLCFNHKPDQAPEPMGT